jgi:hypothetical protein
MQTFSASKGTDSVSSPVRNIASLYPTVSHGGFVDAVLGEFDATYGDAGLGVVDVNPASVGAAGGRRAEEVLQEAEDLKVRSSAAVSGMPHTRSLTFVCCSPLPKAWAWQYGQTPEFTIELESPALSSGARLVRLPTPCDQCHRQV